MSSGIKRQSEAVEGYLWFPLWPGMSWVLFGIISAALLDYPTTWDALSGLFLYFILRVSSLFKAAFDIRGDSQYFTVRHGSSVPAQLSWISETNVCICSKPLSYFGICVVWVAKIRPWMPDKMWSDTERHCFFRTERKNRVHRQSDACRNHRIMELLRLGRALTIKSNHFPALSSLTHVPKWFLIPFRRGDSITTLGTLFQGWAALSREEFSQYPI